MRRRKGKEKMITITLNLPKKQLAMLDVLVGSGIFPNRSEAIRMAVADLISYYLSMKKEYEIAF